MKCRSFLILVAALSLAAVFVFAVFAAGCGGSGATTTSAAPATTLAPDTTQAPGGGSVDGAAIYSANCAVCHGAQGGGGNGPDLRPLGDADVSRVVQQVTQGGSAMPGFDGALSAAEIDAVAAHVVALQ